MSDFVEWNPKRHGQRPPYWTPDTPTGLDNKNFVRQPNWAWIAGTLYYVPYEAVYGVPRPAPVDVGADLTETIHANTIEELRAANERWAIAFKQAEERANERIEALQADKALKIPREPTQAMLKAGDLAWSKGTLILAIWQAMYDAALQETGQ